METKKTITNDNLAVNAIRILSAEAVQKANSGHPGLPMGSAAMAYELWANHMQHNPKNPKWINRDRFVLSAGHGSMLLYSMLHLFNYGLSIDDLKNFRQWNSKTPGHPEYGHTIGVETTTGPLGQGIAMAVGMALAQEHLAARFNTPNIKPIDHYTFALVGDGCMMEGVCAEAASLAGTLGLSKLIVLYDDNNITIEGDTSIAFCEDVGKRHEAYGWNVIKVADGNNLTEIGTAIEQAKKQSAKPTLIMVKTQIAFGSPLAGLAKTHGEPLGQSNIDETKKNLGWKSLSAFDIPQELTKFMQEKTDELAKAEQQWHEIMKEYEKQFPQKYIEFNDCMSGKLPEDLDINHVLKKDNLNESDLWKFSGKNATRNSSGELLNAISKRIPNLFGGSADLAPSNKTELKNENYITKTDFTGKNIHFGVREFAMACMCNGIALHGGLRPFCATFMIFSDYLKPALRLSALMKLNVIYVLTHDSIGVGEDGPTHQPIEQLASLRTIPNVCVYRPADAKETAAAYISALSRKGPTCIALSRQNLPTYNASGKNALFGGYVIDQTDKAVQCVLIASGSEVEVAVEAKKILETKNIGTKVVSMPCMEIFDEQTKQYRDEVLSKITGQKQIATVAIEAAATMPWYKYIGANGAVIGLDHFGASAPAEILFEEFGLTAKNVVETALELVKNN